MLGRLPLVQEQLPELVLLDPGERVVHDRQHEVHEEVEVDAKVGDEKDRGPATVIVRLHHYVRVAVGRKIGHEKNILKKIFRLNNIL